MSLLRYALLITLVGAINGGSLSPDGGGFSLLSEFKTRVEGSGGESGQAAKGSVTYGSPGCGLGNTLISLQTALSIAWVEGRPFVRPNPGRVLKDKVFSRYFHWPTSLLPLPPAAALTATALQINMKPGDGAAKVGKPNPAKRLVISTCWEYDPAGLLQRGGPPLLSALLSQPTARTKKLIATKLEQVGWNSNEEGPCYKIGVQIRVGVDNGPVFHKSGFHKMTPLQVACALSEANKVDGPVCIYITSDEISTVRHEVNAYIDAHPESEKLQIKLQTDEAFMHSAHSLSEVQEDKIMSEWLVLGEADLVYGTGTSFSTSAANRTGVAFRKLPYKESQRCERL
jgi:hypothetical protein